MRDVDPLVALVVDPSRVAEVPVDEISAMILRLSTLAATLSARLATAPPTTTATTGPLLSLDDAAAYLNKSRDWLRHQAAAGRFPCARKVGRTWNFPRTGLEAYVTRVRHIG